MRARTGNQTTNQTPRPTVPASHYPIILASHPPNLLPTPCRRTLFSPSVAHCHWPVNTYARAGEVRESPLHFANLLFINPLSPTLTRSLFFHFLSACKTQ